MMHKIPVSLIYSRLVLGLLIIILAGFHISYYKAIIITFVAIGLLTDIFDGIIARKLNISTIKLRRLDSNVDMFFWIAIVTASYLISPAFYKANYIKLTILIGFEAICYAISFIRFKKEVATHALSAKLWALLLFATLIQLIATNHTVVLFNICFYWGIISRLEIIAMLLVIRQWTNDIPTIYHAFKIRKNKPIKRYKLFNG